MSSVVLYCLHVICVSLVAALTFRLSFPPQQAKEMVMELIREQGFREQRGEYGSRMGGGGGGGGGNGGNGGNGNEHGNGGGGGGGGGEGLDVRLSLDCC